MIHNKRIFKICLTHNLGQFLILKIYLNINYQRNLYIFVNVYPDMC